MADTITNNVNDESEEQKKKEERRIFIIKAISWAMLSCILPVLFIGWRYDLFNVNNKLNLSGYGLIAIVIIFVFLITLFKYFKKLYLVKWSMLGQIIGGLIKVVLPLLAILLVFNSIKNDIDTAITCLGVVIVLETIALPINPFPKYIYEKTNGQTTEMLDLLMRNKKGDK